MVFVRKAQAGSDSFGHVWPEDGSVVEVSESEAVELLKIADAGFSRAEEPVSELEPEPVVDEFSESPAPVRRRGRASSKLVEE